MQARILRWGMLLAAPFAMMACGDGVDGADRIGAGTPVAAASSSSQSTGDSRSGAEYRTASEHFSELQQAALSADYEAFAKHMGAADADAVVARLADSFNGSPFDIYTLEVQDGTRTQRRAAELRGPSGRLYLYLELARADGGWTVRRADFEPDRAALIAHL